MKDQGALDVLVEAARVGDRIFKAADGWRDGRVRTKSNSADLVTEVDLRVQAAVTEFLGPRVPGTRIVAEEAGVPIAGPDSIYLDPLDGTLNFVHGLSEHCISIGYWSGNRPAAGVVLKPSTGDLFTAQVGSGARRNGASIHVSTRNSVRHALFATGWPYDKSLADHVLLQMHGLIGQCQEIRILGSSALAMCYVASGVLDGFWEMGLKPWDLAAGTVIALEAGATVTAHDGEPFRLEIGAVLASNGHVHESLTKILSNPCGLREAP
ncbi:MAG TPA: inositol monophosphatase family protein [Candidatus Acidoferrum sp.]|nr:inositol monophosphatase family protein [Candidatus Acidoferrum sp.]